MQTTLSGILGRLPATDFFVDLPFWGYLLLAVVAYRLAPRKAGLRSWLLLACSVLMLLALPRFSFTGLALMAGLAAGTFLCARLLLGAGEAAVGRRRAIAAVGIVAIVSLLAFFKYDFVRQAVSLRRPSASPGAAGVVFLIGISYSSFKALHFVIEAYKRRLGSPTFLSFLNYLLFFPAFISGPINRYDHFCANSPDARPSTLRADLGAGLERIIHGLFKKTVLAAVLLPYTLSALSGSLGTLTAPQIALGLYAYALYFYFDFSGYTDLAIGTARIMGFVLPENFDFPFLKKNIQQLWANWHISLTSWLTDYIYWPLVRQLRTADRLRKHPLLVSNAAIVVTFLACGLWHGDTLAFLLWGLYHGIGIAAVNTYQNWKRKVRYPPARRYFGSAYSRTIGTVVTFNFFAAGLLPFALDFEQIRALLGRLV